MRRARYLAALLLPLVAGLILAADEPVKAKPKTHEIPYKLTTPRHIVVRVKMNKKGPFNFILDTGAPALIVAVPACKKAGVKEDKKGWGTIDRMELEGGLVMTKVPVRVETPFQLKGMNGMGLAGLEIHGLMGYQILAQYKIEIDFTKTKMLWTKLDYKPAAPLGLGKNVKGNGGGLEMMGDIMGGIGKFLGRKATPEVTLRGFLGLTLENGDEYPSVKAVLAAGPAGKAGVKTGDLITKVQGRTVADVADVLTAAGKLPAGSKMTLTVQRGKETKELSFKTGEGI